MADLLKYEILIRFNPDGEYQGAHQIMQEKITSSRGDRMEFLPAEELSQEQLGDVLDEALISAANQVTILTNQNEQLTDQLNQLQEQLNQMIQANGGPVEEEVEQVNE